ncbi:MULTISPECIES: 16S rRNA (adenine(1518)-N(6)/adenine(1519)-N(6))-dimethyltransferase RsmA [unclassified Caballeronia]|jgi:16S rRNA (adenine1518-N6/adenine1519-N6)-dimethyltransferase|uniref:16S rRNA (adenine(1518)-N(6)/adenine(1519)-N(6))- dimethyltransferase RsmA n=1 Tax=unclassified Caballeronia TaxID=2646786 RepID=UPI00202838DC|nr:MULTISPECIES: 16S rRNA (adenine(1518)-N(6)/adenine(1519)-N(6))-dimethyltransferase RsmA [unclassified Caballeronia]
MSTKHQGHFARKRFGQNFLVDQGVIDSIVDVIAPKRGERMVEIGPGLAALTEPLIARLATPESPLHAVELDRDLIGRLEKRFGDRLVVHSADALDFDFASLALEGEDNEKPTLRIVGNLPYNISSPLLFHLTTFAHKVIDQHFMLQDEVVDRMIAEPASKDYGRLSVMLQYRYVMDKLLDVPPQSFNPPPKVNSAIVRMIPFAPHELPEVDETVLSDVVKAAFAQRRKVLRNNLGAYRDTIDFDALGFDLTRRAEEVPVAEFVALAQAVQRSKV